MFTRARVVILDEPTQGIDVGAKLAVYQLINDLTREGKSVILISSVADELIAMSDRVALVRHGRVVAIRPASQVTPGQLISAAESDHASHRSSSASSGAATTWPPDSASPPAPSPVGGAPTPERTAP
jgi:ABC-type multidrug transport system ATPase subunit